MTLYFCISSSSHLKHASYNTKHFICITFKIWQLFLHDCTKCWAATSTWKHTHASLSIRARCVSLAWTSHWILGFAKDKAHRISPPRLSRFLPLFLIATIAQKSVSHMYVIGNGAKFLNARLLRIGYSPESLLHNVIISRNTTYHCNFPLSAICGQAAG